VARQRRSRDTPFIDTPREARYHYTKRFGIEVSYRLSKQSIVMTIIQNPVVRLLYVVVNLLLNSVVVSTLGVCGDARHGGASPLEVTVHGVYSDDVPSNVDDPRDASARPRKSVT
jgi:hypothetical protein